MVRRFKHESNSFFSSLEICSILSGYSRRLRHHDRCLILFHYVTVAKYIENTHVSGKKQSVHFPQMVQCGYVQYHMLYRSLCYLSKRVVQPSVKVLLLSSSGIGSIKVMYF